jgi:hypothetical protein
MYPTPLDMIDMINGCIIYWLQLIVYCTNYHIDGLKSRIIVGKWFMFLRKSQELTKSRCVLVSTTSNNTHSNRNLFYDSSI